MLPCKILVVDDEPLLQSLVFQKFKPEIQSKKMEFYFAGNGVEALDFLSKQPDIGVILTDIKMPQMDGLTLMRHLSSHDRFYKVIVISAYGDMSNIRKAMDAGASDFILKPFDMKDFEASLIKAIHQFQFLHEGKQAKDKIIEIEKELEIAKEIKKSLIPSNSSLFPKQILISGEMILSESLGGDFYDFFPFSENEVGFFVANVEGKGVPAALYTAIVQMLARAASITCQYPKECMDEINHYLINELPAHSLKGLFYGVFNIIDGTFNYNIAGGVIAYHISKEGKYTEFTIRLPKLAHQTK